ncbi:hypothetical protein OSTOST_06883 [Ostertagia ostertagi]
MSDSESASDENENKNGNVTPQRNSSSGESDSTPSHRSHPDENSQHVPSEKGSDKSDSERSSASPPKGKKSMGSEKSDSERSSASPPKGKKSMGSEKSDSERSSASPPKGKKSMGSEKSDSERSSASPRRERRAWALKRAILSDLLRRLGRSSKGDDKSGKKSPTTAARIFGDDLSSDSDDERGDAVKKKRATTDSDGNKSDASRRSDDSIHGIRMYPEQDEQPEKQLPPTIVDITVSKVNCDFGDGIQFMKIPNFFSVAQKPFDPETYEEDEDDDHVDDEGRNRLKLKVSEWSYPEESGEWNDL